VDRWSSGNVAVCDGQKRSSPLRIGTRQSALRLLEALISGHF
jgi:hypothetical protein